MVFPIADDNTDRRRTPIVTYVIIALNVAVFVFLQQFGQNVQFTFAYAAVPQEIATGEDIVTPDRVLMDPRTRELIRVPGLQPTPLPVYFTLLTSMFMHGGLLHLLGNMWFLFVFGDNVEDDLGPGRYVGFYLLVGVLAAVAHVVVSLGGQGGLTPMVGASGAISGVMGAYLVLHPHRQVHVLLFRLLVVVPGWVAVGLWFLFQVINGLGMLGGSVEGGVAYAAHIGGFLAGMGLSWPFSLGRALRDRPMYRRAPPADWWG
jgi:membrane associated rhomboid family serine protease